MIKIVDWLNRSVSAAPLALFRVLFGFLMAFNTVRFWYFGWIDEHFIKPKMHFTYFGFSWVKPMPEMMMYLLHILAFVAALFIAVGLFYRLSSITFFLLFTYFELIDLTYYLNHYYFISLLSGLIIFMPLANYFSLDVALKRRTELAVLPQWPLLLLKFQLAIVYFYAGLAKINHDWLLEALPLKIWLPADSDLPLIGWLFKYSFTPYFFSWAGMIFDTGIIFFLLSKKTRLPAYFVLVSFHLITLLLFQIGVFPLVMSVLVLLFFSPNWHEKRITQWRNLLPNTSFNSLRIKAIPVHLSPRIKSRGVYLLATYMLFQLLFPWRYVVYPGNLFWTEEGYRFSWRVMLMEKAGTAQFFVKDGQDDHFREVFNQEFLNSHQEKQMSFQPDMILQFAHFLADYYQKRGMENPVVRCEAWVTLNGRPGQLLLNPNLDLTTIKDSWKPKTWILSLTE